MKLRSAVMGSRTVDYERKPALYASECAGCGCLYQMRQWNPNDRDLGTMRGTFECRTVCDENGRGRGNMFHADVCSFACADMVMKGGWKKIERYRPFADANAILVRVELQVTALVVKQPELEAEWEAAPETEH